MPAIVRMRAGGGDLRQAQPEDLLAQAPQSRRHHLQADDEQQHHDAEFGDMQDGLSVGEKAQTERTDRDAGRQIAQHGAKSEFLEQRYGDYGSCQQSDHMPKVAPRRFRRHSSLRKIR